MRTQPSLAKADLIPPIVSPIGARFAVPLRQRKVCKTCGHLHRRPLMDRCACCRRDITTKVKEFGHGA